MQLSVEGYNILSDLHHAISADPIRRKAALSRYNGGFSELYERAGIVLDWTRRRHWEQNKRTAEYIAKKRAVNKNYARKK